MAAVADSSPCRAFPRRCGKCGRAICLRPFAAGAGGRVILRRNIKCFGAGESQVESLVPDLIRRGRIPRVGINATRATIILRIVAEGDSEEQCRAQMEPTVAEIHKHLGTLVFGEGDDELQDVVLRILGQRGQTLASVEIGTAGLVAQWLGKAGGSGGPYRGGLVAMDDAAMARLLPLGPAESAPGGEPGVLAMAIACRQRFQTDFGLAVGPLPSAGDEGEAKRVHFALASATGMRTFHVSSGIHPDIVVDYCAKHAINLARLTLLKQEAPAGPLPARPAGE